MVDIERAYGRCSADTLFNSDQVYTLERRVKYTGNTKCGRNAAADIK